MFTCKVCNVSLHGVENYQIHMSGRKHKLAEGRALGVQGTQGTPIPIAVLTDEAALADVGDGAEFRCDVCSTIIFGKENYKIHIEGRKHLNKVKSSNANSSVVPTGAVATSPTPSTPHTVSSDTTAGVVPAGVTVPAGAGGDTYVCTFCETTIFGNENYTLHLQGKKHLNKVRSVNGVDGEAASGTASAVAVTISDADDGAEFSCDICDTKVCGKANYKTHMEGRKHLNKVRELANGGVAPAPQMDAESSPAAVVPNDGGDTYKCVVCDTLIFGKDNYTLHVKGKKHLFKAALSKTEIQFMASDITSKVVGSPAARVKMIHPSNEDEYDDEDDDTWRSLQRLEQGNLFAVCVEECYEGGVGCFPWYPKVLNSQHPLHAPSYTVVGGVIQPNAASCKVVCSVQHTIPLLPHASIKITDVELCGGWFDVLFGNTSSVGAQYRQAATLASTADEPTSAAAAASEDDDDDICMDMANFIYCEVEVGGDDSDNDSVPTHQYHPRWRLTAQVVSQEGNPLITPFTTLHESDYLADLPTSHRLAKKSEADGANIIRFPVSSPLSISGNSDGDSVFIEITLHLLMSTTEAISQGDTWLEQFRLSHESDALPGPVCRLYGIPC